MKFSLSRLGLNFPTHPMKANPMKSMQPSWRRLLPSLVPCLLALWTCLGVPRVQAQGTPNAPDRLTYQGFLVDANGAALGATAPRNYDIVFRIYDDASAGALVWAEQQTVTVDKGNFSVILGEGIEISPEPRPVLSNVFKGATASERYIAITVKGIGPGGANVDIMPRLRLLTSPYAFLAQQATKLVKSDGTDLLSANSSAMLLDGSLSLRQANALEFGSGITKEPNAGRIGYGLFTPNTLDIVGGGTSGANRQVRIWAEGGTVFNGPVTAPVFNGSGAGLTGVAKTQPGGHLIVGDPVAAGTTGYGSAVVFAGAPGNENTDPLWISRFNRNPNESQLLVSIGDDPGSAVDKMIIGAMQGNGGNFTQNGSWTPLFGFTAQPFFGVGTDTPAYPIDIRSGDPRIQMMFGGSTSMMQVGRAGAGNTGYAFIGLNNHRLGNGFAWAVYDGDSNWDFSSDRKLKKDIVDAEPMLERALKVQVRRFRWKEMSSDSPAMLGVVAQELQPLFPGMVTEVEHPETRDKQLTVGYGDFGVIAIKSIQEMKAAHDEEVKQLRSELDEVKGQLREVLAAVKQLQGGAGTTGRSSASGR